MISVDVGQKIVICNLQKYMEDSDLNITQLSKIIGVTQNTIRSYVQNRFNRIDCEVAIKICNHFDVSFGEMFEIVKGN
ncbi:helix-turn-helix domain-containing protein [Fischerella sp. PCC 9605]|uniref:helix-turn-helix domain-containing protein n=1 Tax=Fischerella sp. PCC 9605 TaxID=1173024 RepID=UPI000551DF53|nr:helix-turn-helix transcriptional regulator [Fischerella sp. PCC 9605]